MNLKAITVLLIACICGWFVMELEILGVRMLAPYFGSAVYVVTGSVIGVFLLSLSIGYILGGWLTTKSSRHAMLGINLLIVGTWSIVLPFMAEPVCDAIFRIGLDEKWGSLLASLILFGIPTVLLGTVSPTVIHWLGEQSRQAGLNAGVVLAASTIASFAGCVITAFYLVLFSMRLTLQISGIVLFLLGVAVLFYAAISRQKQVIAYRLSQTNPESPTYEQIR